MSEVRRGVDTLGLLGPQIFNVSRGVPLDHPSLENFWSELERLGAPAWLHPERRGTIPEYPGEADSRYSLFLVLGWPYETSIAMARLVFSGVLETTPPPQHHRPPRRRNDSFSSQRASPCTIPRVSNSDASTARSWRDPSWMDSNGSMSTPPYTARSQL